MDKAMWDHIESGGMGGWATMERLSGARGRQAIKMEAAFNEACERAAAGDERGFLEAQAALHREYAVVAGVARFGDKRRAAWHEDRAREFAERAERIDPA